MITQKHLTYRGEIRAAVGVGGTLVFVTAHPEGQATGLYRLDADSLSLDVAPLPKGGAALAADDQTVWVAGTDNRVYEAPASTSGGAPKPLGPTLDEAPTALAPLAEGRLAVLTGSRAVVLARKGGKILQTLDLPEPGTCLAADPTGRWLAAGTAKGTVAVFDAEDKPEFLLSASERLHEGAVSALLFELDELRVLSAGADLKLLSTHARGRLEPEDKGRGNNHADLVTALTWGPGDRLYSGGRDAAIKSWPRAGGVKPATTRDGVGRVVSLAVVLVHDRPRLVAACDDSTVRVFLLDAAGKVGDCTQVVSDAYARAGHELSQDDPARREAALKALAGYGDARSVELIAGQTAGDPDHALRLRAAEFLGASAHPRAEPLLAKCLEHPDEAVRVAGFCGLRTILGENDLKPIDLALKAEKADVGRLAVQALEPLAARDDRAHARLTDALDAKTPEVRLAAVVSLEAARGPGSPASNLVALGSKHADVRRSALVRLFRRKLLDEPAVQSALRRRTEDSDPDVRLAAFLLSLHTRARLLQALGSRDPEVNRQLLELEGATPGEETPIREKPKEKEKEKEKKSKSPKAAPGGGKEALDDADLEPLLQATASRALDTCLRGARGLALLGDPRAFGLLLQLSREEDKTARAEVCRALGALDDVRAVDRLRSMLHDNEAEVRDAAFTALARIHQSDPLLAAESGLNASHEDVRSRGLQALTAEVRKAPTSEPALRLLARALDDSAPAVRAEAFKSALGLPATGGGPGPLRFAARSVHPDVRRSVFIEAAARVGEPDGWDLVLEFFDDPDPALRDEAFAFAVKKTKGLEFLEAGLGSRHADLRRRSVDALVKKHTAASQALLIRALDDEDRDVRLSALESLVHSDAVPALAAALASPHPDVRVRAARALARHGDPRALAPLVALATTPEPTEAERRPDWLVLAGSALAGLGELGDPAALPDLIPPLDSPHAALRAQAARALVWVCRPGATDALRQGLRHSDPEVKYHAALGLAFAGDASVSSLVFSEPAGKVVGADRQLAAALALGAEGEDQLVILLDDASESTRTRALLLLLFREWKDPQGSAARCLACLSSRTPRFRLTAARALETLANPAAFADFVTNLANDRGEKPAWKIPGPTVDALAEVLVHGDPRLRARSSALLALLGAEEQHAFDQAWSVHAARFAPELAELRRRAGGRTPVLLKYTPAQLRELAFGAYVGLVREQGGSRRKKGQDAGPDPQVVRVRQSALGRLLALAETDPHHAAAARPVFVQAMGDPNQAARVQAFEHALAAGLPPTALAAEALATGFTDLGVKGLELLTGGVSESEARAVLEEAALRRNDDLAVKAADLLAARLGAVAVAVKALEAAHEPLRKQAVSWLAAGYDNDPHARDALRGALRSRYREVREAAAFELGAKKDPAAFDALAALLTGANLPVPQKRVITALEALGDPRAPAAFLDRVENDPADTAAADDLLRAAGRSRRPDVVDRLVTLWETQPKRREAVFNALLTVSGYDQAIEDPDDERPDDDWLGRQFPRNDDVLARLMGLVTAPTEARFLARLLPSARWARGAQVDPVLAGLVNHPDENTRREAVRALGWRLRKRSGGDEPLRRALGHRDPVTQFVAAEGLARAGRSDGLNVLLASIDFASDLDVRTGAVTALGELADERALDTLLKLATEDGHALQETAAEAIGHMGRSPRAEEVFRLLERFAKGAGGVSQSALLGMRWFNTQAGWQVIRARAADPAYGYRRAAIGLLGYDDDPATRDLLLRLLSGGEETYVVEGALTSARRLWGRDSLEPAYAVLGNDLAPLLDDFDETLDRVIERGESGRIFGVCVDCPEDVREPLTTGLLSRPELPTSEAKAALDSPDPATAGLAARVLGRAGAAASGSGSGSGPVLAGALMKWRSTWAEKRNAFDVDPYLKRTLGVSLLACLRNLVWAAGRLGVARETLADIASSPSDDPGFTPVRLEAVLALASGEMTADVAQALESAAREGAPEIRAAAAQAIGRGDPELASALAEPLLSDRVSFRRLTLGGGEPDLGETLRAAARQVHYQGVVLPALIERGDLTTLAAVAEDRTLPEATRLGAIEGLAALGREPAEDVLRRVGTLATEDEDLRWAALRGLRRSRRARTKAETAKAKVTP